MYNIDDFVNKVLAGKGSLETNRKALLSVLDPSAKTTIKGLNFQKLLKDLEDSLWELFQKETPPSSTKLIHFGLRETADGCCLYVVGTRQKEPPEFRDSEEWDWVGPDSGCLNIPQLNRLWENLSGAKEEEWEVVLAVTIIVLKSYFDDNTESFMDMIGLESVIITTGFDDGDLYEIPLKEK